MKYIISYGQLLTLSLVCHEACGMMITASANQDSATVNCTTRPPQTPTTPTSMGGTHLACKNCHTSFATLGRFLKHSTSCPRGLSVGSKRITKAATNGGEVKSIVQPAPESNDPPRQKTRSTQTRQVCSLCEKTFDHFGNYNAHLLTHTEFKPYRYNDCGSGFDQVAKLKKHQLTHMPQKLLTCEHCTRPFSRRGNLQRHQHSDGKTASLRCSECKGTNLVWMCYVDEFREIQEDSFHDAWCDDCFDYADTEQIKARAI